jgi:hypothetical protein
MKLTDLKASLLMLKGRKGRRLQNRSNLGDSRVPEDR